MTWLEWIRARIRGVFRYPSRWTVAAMIERERKHQAKFNPHWHGAE